MLLDGVLRPISKQQDLVHELGLNDPHSVFIVKEDHFEQNSILFWSRDDLI